MTLKRKPTQILNPYSKTESGIHFNRPLSRDQTVKCIAVFKWQAKAKIKFYMKNRGQKYTWQADAIIIRRADILKVHDYARQNCCLRDYLLIRLPMKIGLRTGEICSLKIENINFQDKTFHVLDSKRKRLYPLPLDALTLQLIQDLIGPRQEGYVFTREVYSRSWSHKKAEKPLHVTTVLVTVKRIALKVGVEGFTPRLLRHYFAAEWHKQGGSLELLRRILRHKSLAYTQFYLSRLVYFEDLKGEYEKLQNGPLTSPQQPQFYKTESLTPKICSSCANLPICKLVDRMPSWATGCQYYKKEALVKNEQSGFDTS